MALVMIADQLKKSCRTSDLIARLGGEEFGVILPCTSAKDSLFLAERIRKSIEASAIRLDNGETVRITVSIGVAELSDSIVTAEQLYKTADLALYDAKHGGRNTIRQAA
jgi:diguanylate cyclase